MRKENFYFQSNDKRTNIHGVIWYPARKPVAVLQISHGVTEYAERYASFAEYFTRRGIVVIAHDHLGHGESVAENAQPMYFGPEGSWSYTVKDLLSVCVAAKRMFPNIPYYLMGFSMGSFIARQFLIEYPNCVDAAIIMGTGQTSTIEILLGKFMANQEAKKVGEDHTSDGIKALTFGTYNKPFEKEADATDFEWLCSNKDALREYAADPKIGGPMSAGLFREMLSGMQFTGKMKNIRKMNKYTPVLFISGDADPVGKNGKGVMKAAKAFMKAGIQDVQVKLYKGLRHDILREKNSEEIYQFIYAYIMNL